MNFSMKTILQLTLIAACSTSMATVCRGQTKWVRGVDWSKYKGMTGLQTGDAFGQRTATVLRNQSRYLYKWVESHYPTEKNLPAFKGTPAYSPISKDGYEATVRPLAQFAWANAAMIKTGIYDPSVAGLSESEALNRTELAIRGVAMTHRANKNDGYNWGQGSARKQSWQAGYWASQAAEAAWMLWDDISGDTKDAVSKMVEYEANGLMNYTVPYWKSPTGHTNSPGDTKAEENAWNSRLLTVAQAMMPDHPNIDRWRLKASELMVSSYSRPSDLTNAAMVDGKQVKQWLNGYNTFDDGMLVNHRIAHPGYVTAHTMTYSTAIDASLAGQYIPKSAFFNAQFTWDAITKLKFTPGANPYGTGKNAPPGGTIYHKKADGTADPMPYFPHGNDWSSNPRGRRRLCAVRCLWQHPGIGCRPKPQRHGLGQCASQRPADAAKPPWSRRQYLSRRRLVSGPGRDRNRHLPGSRGVVDGLVAESTSPHRSNKRSLGSSALETLRQIAYDAAAGQTAVGEGEVHAGDALLRVPLAAFATEFAAQFNVHIERLVLGVRDCQPHPIAQFAHHEQAWPIAGDAHGTRRHPSRPVECDLRDAESLLPNGLHFGRVADDFDLRLLDVSIHLAGGNSQNNNVLIAFRRGLAAMVDPQAENVARDLVGFLEFVDAPPCPLPRLAFQMNRQIAAEDVSHAIVMHPPCAVERAAALGNLHRAAGIAGGDVAFQQALVHGGHDRILGCAGNPRAEADIFFIEVEPSLLRRDSIDLKIEGRAPVSAVRHSAGEGLFAGAAGGERPISLQARRARQLAPIPEGKDIRVFVAAEVECRSGRRKDDRP